MYLGKLITEIYLEKRHRKNGKFSEHLNERKDKNNSRDLPLKYQREGLLGFTQEYWFE